MCVYTAMCECKVHFFLQMLSMTLLRVDGRIHRKEVQTRCMIVYSVRANATDMCLSVGASNVDGRVTCGM